MMGIGLGGPNTKGALVRYIRMKEATLWAWLAGATLFGVFLGIATGLLVD